MISLYDYLGHPAGITLGHVVHTIAKSQKELITTKQVEAVTYSGKVKMYRKEFLDKFFKEFN